jgi:hypothetical protein
MIDVRPAERTGSNANRGCVSFGNGWQYGKDMWYEWLEVDKPVSRRAQNQDSQVELGQILPIPFQAPS